MSHLLGIPTQDHAPGQCACPKLRAVGWIDTAANGRDQPHLLVVPQSNAASRDLKRLARHAGLQRHVLCYATATMVHLGTDTATLAVDAQRIEQIPVSREWNALARDRGSIRLIVGMRPAEHGRDTYLHQHGARTLTGLVPVAGAANDGRCTATTTALDHRGPPAAARYPRDAYGSAG